MPTYKTPGVYVEEISTLSPSIAEVATAIPAFIGYTAIGPVAKTGTVKMVPIVKRINTMLDYEALFGGPCPSKFTITTKVDADTKVTSIASVVRDTSKPSADFLLYYSLSLYFKNGGGSCYIVSIGNYDASPSKDDFEQGLAALEKEDEPTLILLTDAVNLAAADYYTSVCQGALKQCGKLKDRFAILDVKASDTAVADFRGTSGVGTENLKYGAAYYPYLQTALTYVYNEELVIVNSEATATDSADKKTPAKKDAAADTTMVSIRSSDTSLYQQIKTRLSQERITLPPSAAIAGVYASVDRDRGVWKAPANVSLASVIGPAVKINQAEQEELNVDPTAGKSINAIREFAGKGTLVWGARTLAGNDNEWRYVSVRRLFNMIEESAQKATFFAVFEPNDATTWLKVKAMIESYLYGLWQQGALAGQTPDEAYYVHVGLGQTMRPQDVLEGRMFVNIGVAAVRPAEFIVLNFMHKLQQA